jgi:hypothetical protein
MEEKSMRRVNWVLMITMLFLISLVVFARLPQGNPSQQPQPNQARIDAAPGKLLAGEDESK